MRPLAASKSGDDQLQIRRFSIRVIAAGGLLEVLLIASVWGRWGVIGALLALHLTRLAQNAVAAPWVRSRIRPSTADQALASANLLLSIAEAHVSGWTYPAWALITLSILLMGGFAQKESRGRAAVHLAIFCIAGLLDGASPRTALFFATLTVILYIVADFRFQLLREATAEVQRQHDELAEAHAELGQIQGCLVEQEKLNSLGVLASGVAHEINNPMSYVTANVQLLLEELRRQPSLPDELVEYREEVLPSTVDGIMRVNGIVADLRRFAGRAPMTMAEFDLNDELRAAVRLSKAQLMRVGCTLELDLQALPLAFGNGHRIAQVFVNLLVNAAQASSKGGRVELQSWKQGSELFVRVRDQGCGIPEESLRNVFQPFFTTKEVGEGTGLGLAVAHGIIQAHGGRIELESSVGVGTTFTIRLPEATRSPLAARADLGSSLASRAG